MVWPLVRPPQKHERLGPSRTGRGTELLYGWMVKKKMQYLKMTSVSVKSSYKLYNVLGMRLFGAAAPNSLSALGLFSTKKQNITQAIYLHS